MNMKGGSMLLPHNKVSGGVQGSQIMIPSFFDRFYVMPPLTNGVHYIIMLPFLILYMELRKIPLFGLVPYWIKTVLIAILFHWTPRMRFPMSNAQDNKTD